MNIDNKHKKNDSSNIYNILNYKKIPNKKVNEPLLLRLKTENLNEIKPKQKNNVKNFRRFNSSRKILNPLNDTNTNDKINQPKNCLTLEDNISKNGEYSVKRDQSFQNINQNNHYTLRKNNSLSKEKLLGYKNEKQKNKYDNTEPQKLNKFNKKFNKDIMPVILDDKLNNKLNNNPNTNRIKKLNKNNKKNRKENSDSKEKKNINKGKSQAISNYFLYKENKDFLLKFKVNKDQKNINIECLNTKKISKDGEMFSNNYDICEILNIPQYNEELDVVKTLQDLFKKNPPLGKFNTKQEEFNLVINYGNDKNTFVLLRHICKDNEFIKKNIIKKINQNKNEKLKKLEQFLEENKNLIEVEEKLGIKIEVNKDLIECNELIKKLLSKLENIKL